MNLKQIKLVAVLLSAFALTACDGADSPISFAANNPAGDGFGFDFTYTLDLGGNPAAISLTPQICTGANCTL